MLATITSKLHMTKKPFGTSTVRTTSESKTSGARKQAKVAWPGDSGLITNPFSGFPNIAVLQGMSRRDEEPPPTRRKVVWSEVKASVAALTKYQLQGLPLVLSQSLHRGLQL